MSLFQIIGQHHNPNEGKDIINYNFLLLSAFTGVFGTSGTTSGSTLDQLNTKASLSGDTFTGEMIFNNKLNAFGGIIASATEEIDMEYAGGGRLNLRDDSATIFSPGNHFSLTFSTGNTIWMNSGGTGIAILGTSLQIAALDTIALESESSVQFTTKSEISIDAPSANFDVRETFSLGDIYDQSGGTKIQMNSFTGITFSSPSNLFNLTLSNTYAALVNTGNTGFGIAGTTMQLLSDGLLTFAAPNTLFTLADDFIIQDNLNNQYLAINKSLVQTKFSDGWVIANSFSGNSVSATTYFSGSTPLSTIIANLASSSGTSVFTNGSGVGAIKSNHSSNNAAGDYSFALGIGNLAAEDCSIAIGSGSTASTRFSLAIGASCQVEDNLYNYGSYAIGFESSAITSTVSLAMGYKSLAYFTLSSMAFGVNSKVLSGTTNLTFGSNNYISESSYSLSFGESVLLNDNNGTLGLGSNVVGNDVNNSTLIGNALTVNSSSFINAIAGSTSISNTDNSSIIGGGHIVSNSNNSLVIGDTNKTYSANTVVIGTNSSAMTTNNYVFGSDIKSYRQNEFAVGKRAHTYSPVASSYGTVLMFREFTGIGTFELYTDQSTLDSFSIDTNLNGIYDIKCKINTTIISGINQGDFSSQDFNYILKTSGGTISTLLSGVTTNNYTDISLSGISFIASVDNTANKLKIEVVAFGGFAGVVFSFAKIDYQFNPF